MSFWRYINRPYDHLTPLILLCVLVGTDVVVDVLRSAVR